MDGRGGNGGHAKYWGNGGNGGNGPLGGGRGGNDAFSLIFDRIPDKDFDRANYSCLVSYYESGASGITAHQDNEDSIEPGSTIYTVSVGAEREMIFTSTDGSKTTSKLQLTHGSVFTMTAESQKSWKHGIPLDLDVKEPRISFTFRKMKRPNYSTQLQKPPPPSGVENLLPPGIEDEDCYNAHSTNYAGDMAMKDVIMAKKKPVLCLLTDSIIRHMEQSDLPGYIFHKMNFTDSTGLQFNSTRKDLKELKPH